MSIQFIFSLLGLHPQEEPLREFFHRISQNGLSQPRDVDRYYKEREVALEAGILYRVAHSIHIERDTTEDPITFSV